MLDVYYIFQDFIECAWDCDVGDYYELHFALGCVRGDESMVGEGRDL